MLHQARHILWRHHEGAPDCLHTNVRTWYFYTPCVSRISEQNDSTPNKTKEVSFQKVTYDIASFFDANKSSPVWSRFFIWSPSPQLYKLTTLCHPHENMAERGTDNIKHRRVINFLTRSYFPISSITDLRWNRKRGGISPNSNLALLFGEAQVLPSGGSTFFQPNADFNGVTLFTQIHQKKFLRRK